MSIKQKVDKSRIPIMILSGFCGVSLYGLGILSREMDTEYILMAGFVFFACFFEPMVVRMYLYHKAQVEKEKKEQEQAEKRRIQAEKQKQKDEAERIRLEELEKREKQAMSQSGDSVLKKRASTLEKNWFNKRAYNFCYMLFLFII